MLCFQCMYSLWLVTFTKVLKLLTKSYPQVIKSFSQFVPYIHYLVLDHLLAFKSDFKVIDIGELLSNVADSLLQEETVLVTKNDKVVTVLTNIDILRFISGKNSI